MSKNIHFIAIGGAIMHQLAITLHQLGHHVSGSDDEINDPAKTNLQHHGLLPEKAGWFPEKITSETEAIVLGMHAKSDNPELKKAQESGTAIYSFPEYMYEVGKEKKRVVIAGSHGKTTITSMIMHVLNNQKIPFDYLVGAKVEGFENSVRITDAPLLLLEGDEYPASVLEKRPKIFFYHPQVTLISGIAWDHINVFPTFENYFEQFTHYVNHLKPGTIVVYNEEDEQVKKLIAQAPTHLKYVSYKTPSYKHEGHVAVLQSAQGEVPLKVFGRHNMLNIEGAKKVCETLGISEENFYNSIKDFGGAARRLEKIIEQPGLTVYRDFAHAPSKLMATLSGVKEALPHENVVACFELHTFSSLNDNFLEQYKDSMNSADVAIVYFSEHALKLKGLPLLDPEKVRQHFDRDDLMVIHEKSVLENYIIKTLSDKSVPTNLLLMSSGTFDGIEWNAIVSQKINSK